MGLDYKKKSKKRYIQINIVLIFICIVAFFSINELKNIFQDEIGKSLKTVLNSSQKTYNLWVDQLKNDISKAVENPKLISLTEKLIQYPADSSILINSKIQKEIREIYFSDIRDDTNHGFFIISPKDYISLSSSRNTNIGTKNLIAGPHSALLNKIENGEFVFIPPMFTDVLIENTINQQLTMFYGAPIKNEKGKVIAIFTLRIDPFKTFALLAKPGSIGETGETYLINEKGFLLTQSRFTEDLRKNNLVSGNDLGILNFKIIDPGVNLKKNKRGRTSAIKKQLTLAGSNLIKKKDSLCLTPYNNFIGIPVFGAWKWDNTLNVGIITEINESEALYTYYLSRNILLFTLLTTVFLVALLTIIIIRKTEKSEKELLKINDHLEESVKIRTSELQKAIETKNIFFSIIAHDLKGPLSSFSSLTKILYERWDTMDKISVVQMIGSMNESAKGIYSLLQNLLDWAMTQQNTIQIQKKEHELYNLSEISIRPIINLARQKEITITNEIDKNYKVFVDEYMITTVIRNLVSNAIKYTENKGIIRICAEKSDQHIAVSIIDDGVGMNDDTSNKLFKLDQHITIPGTQNETGSGLGLILCKEFVEKHGGEISVQSQLNKGSTFKFTLPFTK